MSWKSWFTSELPSNADIPQLLPVPTSMSVHYFSTSLSVNLLGLQLLCGVLQAGLVWYVNRAALRQGSYSDEAVCNQQL